jgi:hypothetical protein
MNMDKFETWATRSSDKWKIDFEGFLNPLVLESFWNYMLSHQTQADWKLRTSDNWQKWMPIDNYMKSLLRHAFDVWKLHRGYEVYKEWKYWGKEECLNALFFNVQWYLFEIIKNKDIPKDYSNENYDPTDTILK